MLFKRKKDATKAIPQPRQAPAKKVPARPSPAASSSRSSSSSRATEQSVLQRAVTPVASTASTASFSLTGSASASQKQDVPEAPQVGLPSPVSPAVALDAFKSRVASVESPPPPFPTFPTVTPPPVKLMLERRRPREALCKAILVGEGALEGLHAPHLDVAGLASHLQSACPAQHGGSSFSIASTSEAISFPSTQQASFAVAAYFTHVEPSLQLFPTNYSRTLLYNGCRELWQSGAHCAGRGWEALYLTVTAMGAAAVADGREDIVPLTRSWIEIATRTLLVDENFASKPTLEGLRNILLLMHCALLGSSDSVSVSSAIAHLPVVVASAYALDLHRDPDELGLCLTVDEVEERRGLWWQIVMLETMWAPLLFTRVPGIDLSTTTTRLPFFLSAASPPTPLSTPPSVESSLISVIRLTSRLSRLLNSARPVPPLDLYLLFTELDGLERKMKDDEDPLVRGMLHSAVLRLQAFAEELGGAGAAHETEWARHVRDLLKLVDAVPGSDQAHRLPALLWILQGAILAALRLHTLAPSYHAVAASLSPELHDLTSTLRATPWPTYMHPTVKRGVIVLEHLLRLGT
ncbi:hypothetical protein JCM5296_006588 [Sporobolomyces johnsonii]